MRILALDTCLPACSVAVIDGERVLARISEPMTRGHQERLAPMAKEAMGAAGLAFSQLDRIGVTVGPGSFTGLRVGLAFAKGLSAALSIPCVGVGALEALARLADGLVVAVVDAKRGQVYLQVFEDGRALTAPDALAVETAAARLAELQGGRAAKLVGSGAGLLAPALPGAMVLDIETLDPVDVARITMTSDAAPRPLYLRAPDARLPA